MWVVGGIALGVLILGLLVFVFLDPYARNVQQANFPDVVRQLLTRIENGGFCRFNHQGSEVWFSIERLQSENGAAILVLRVPRQDWALKVSEELRRVYESNDYEFLPQDDNVSLFAKVLIPVEDIWAVSSSARGAHAARMFLNTVGIAANAKFNVEIVGSRVDRVEK